MSDSLSATMGFNTDPNPIALPRDFISACKGLSSNALLLLVHFFSMLAETELAMYHISQKELIENFSKWHGCSEQDATSLLSELMDARLLILWKEEGINYLIPGTPQGRFLYQQLNLGEKSLTSKDGHISLEDKRPNIFKLYETHIGLITPMMAEQLKQDEKDFPADWIEDAIREAVQRNARNWKYVKAILLAWKERGRDKRDEGHKSDIEAFRKLTREQQERNPR